MSEDNVAENIGGGCDSSNSTKLCASVAFVQSLQNQVNKDDIYSIIQSQKHMLTRFEKTNEMLVNCNSLLTGRYSGASKELKKQIAFLMDLKKDLESIFRRIRFLKMKLSQQYTEAFSDFKKTSQCLSFGTSHVFNALDEEEEQEEKEGRIDKILSEISEGATNVSSSCSRASSPRSTSPATSDT